MTKLLENTHRFINISFINDFAQLCEKMEIDVNEVIDAASTKPYGFTRYTPSVGIGGHCIPIDLEKGYVFFGQDPNQKTLLIPAIIQNLAINILFMSRNKVIMSTFTLFMSVLP
jgi:UDP-N-acetyl-D-mannosaminuronate dehydrogenase